MGIGTPSESPAVVVKEIDLTGGVPNTQSTTGAAVLNARWGPVDVRTLVDNEDTLVDRFASPDSSTTISFHEANFFLKYSSKLQVIRAIDANAKNSLALPAVLTDDSAGFLAKPVVKNTADFERQVFENGTQTRGQIESDGQTNIRAGYTFIGKFPGELGNSLEVQMCPVTKTADGTATDSAFNDWGFKDNFDGPPGTSTHTAARLGANDEVHVAVVDKGGQFTGTRNTVLETFPFLSVAFGAKNPDGTTNFIKDVINKRSEYVWFANFDSSYSGAGAGLAASISADSGRDYNLGTFLASKGFNRDSDNAVSNIDPKGQNIFTARRARSYLFSSGVDVEAAGLGTSEILTAFDFFEDKDQVEIDFLIAPSMVSRADTTTVVNDLVATAQNLRKDCVVTASPARNDIVETNASTSVTNVVATADTFTKSSYLFMDNNYLKVYDKFNDQFINIAAASSTAGIMAATDLNRAAWFSPAGSRRGQYLGITSIAYSPTKSQRDTLYKAQVNPIANIPGAGVVLFGDKTKLARPSAFDRINVRRLFLVLERAIARAAEQVLFEFNDEFTRAEFVNIVEPVLREVKGRRGITDFRVVADETNNTPAVIDRNEFIASIFIKPARSINYVTLNFVAVRTGVDFEEVVGTV